MNFNLSGIVQALSSIIPNSISSFFSLLRNRFFSFRFITINTNHLRNLRVMPSSAGGSEGGGGGGGGEEEESRKRKRDNSSAEETLEQRTSRLLRTYNNSPEGLRRLIIVLMSYKVDLYRIYHPDTHPLSREVYFKLDAVAKAIITNMYEVISILRPYLNVMYPDVLNPM